jgi:membrane-associated phospholipid phosphatase
MWREILTILKLVLQLGKDKTLLFVLVASIFSLPTGYAQIAADDRRPANAGSSESMGTDASRSVESSLVPHLLVDQKDFWTGPLRMRLGDSHWLVPFAAFTSALIGSDTSIEKELPTSSTVIKRSQNFSNFGVASLAGTAGVFYFWGRLTNNDHARETGLLSSEALADAVLVSSLIQETTGRDRPLGGNGLGRFGQGGTSFPSDHAAAAWSLATVLAYEYPGPFTKLLPRSASFESLAANTFRRMCLLGVRWVGIWVAKCTGRTIVGNWGVRSGTPRRRTGLKICPDPKTWALLMFPWTVGYIRPLTDWQRWVTCKAPSWDYARGRGWSAQGFWERLRNDYRLTTTSGVWDRICTKRWRKSSQTRLRASVARGMLV